MGGFSSVAQVLTRSYSSPVDSAQKHVSDFYEKLWKDIPAAHVQDVIPEFLHNVGLPGDWFREKICIDVGCGPGYAVWVMEQLGARCHACDISHSSWLKAREQIDGYRSARVFTNCSAIDLPFPSDFFDFVHCNGVLHHTIHPRGGFSELVRVTHPGGILFVSVYGKGGIYNMFLQAARLVASCVPYKLAEETLRLLLKNRRVPNSFMPASVSVLDNLYVPIRQSYHEHDIVKWFLEEGFSKEDVKRTKTTIYDYQKNISRLIHGEGYLQFSAKRPLKNGF